MNALGEIVCFGDLMLECILHVQSLPPVGPTLVIDGRPREPGGTAYNLAWYFAQWGYRAKLVAVTGDADERLVAGALQRASLPDDSLIRTIGETDYLLVLADAVRSWAIYLRAQLPDGVETHVVELCRTKGALILGGSRHPRLRAASAEAARVFDGRLLAFSPSYAIYEYTANEILALSRRADLVVLNESELAFALSCTGFRDLAEFGKQVRGRLLITYADRGAELFYEGGCLRFPSISNRTGDVIGAGDAFSAGFVHAVLNNETDMVAGAFGAWVAARLVESGGVRARIDRESFPSVPGAAPSNG